MSASRCYVHASIWVLAQGTKVATSMVGSRSKLVIPCCSCESSQSPAPVRVGHHFAVHEAVAHVSTHQGAVCKAFPCRHIRCTMYATC
eukprot:78526-Chlamydomonas_euryale.AAC.3